MKKPKRRYTIKTEFNLRCYTCGELISKDGNDGMAVWGEKGLKYEANGIKYPGIAQFTIVHKGKCDDKDKYQMSSELIDVFRKTRRKMR